LGDARRTIGERDFRGALLLESIRSHVESQLRERELTADRLKVRSVSLDIQPCAHGSGQHFRLIGDRRKIQALQFRLDLRGTLLARELDRQAGGQKPKRERAQRGE